MRKAATSLHFLKNQLQIEIMIETVIVVVIIEGSLEMIEEEEVVMIEVIATIMIVEETVTIMIELMIMNKRKSKTMEKVQRKLLLRKTKLPQRNFCLHFRLVNQNHQGKIAMWYHSKFDVLQ